jgi:hypothetical protein
MKYVAKGELALTLAVTVSQLTLLSSVASGGAAWGLAFLIGRCVQYTKASTVICQLLRAEFRQD